jgi:hypothetical protein
MSIPIRISHKKNKKYDIFINGKWLSFGDKRYEHYKTSDLIPYQLHIYEEHHDLKRRQSYLKRALNIKNKFGQYTKDDINSPNYYAIRLLW